MYLIYICIRSLMKASMCEEEGHRGAQFAVISTARNHCPPSELHTPSYHSFQMGCRSRSPWVVFQGQHHLYGRRASVCTNTLTSFMLTLWCFVFLLWGSGAAGRGQNWDNQPKLAEGTFHTIWHHGGGGGKNSHCSGTSWASIIAESSGVVHRLSCKYT